MLNSRIIQHCQITELGLPEETRAFASCEDATGSIKSPKTYWPPCVSVVLGLYRVYRALKSCTVAEIAHLQKMMAPSGVIYKSITLMDFLSFLSYFSQPEHWTKTGLMTHL